MRDTNKNGQQEINKSHPNETSVSAASTASFFSFGMRNRGTFGEATGFSKPVFYGYKTYKISPTQILLNGHVFGVGLPLLYNEVRLGSLIQYPRPEDVINCDDDEVLQP